MNILIFTPAFLVFIYCLYKLVKDDYVFIRKNVSSEQLIDIAFFVTWVSLFFSRLFSFLLYPLANDGQWQSFFSFKVSDFSILGLVIGAILGLYFIGRYKKLPIGRLFDFFTTALAVGLPIGFFSAMIFVKEYILLLYFLNAVIYSFFAFYFVKYVRFKTSVFILFFSFITLLNNLLLQFLNKNSFVTVENVLLLLLMFIALVFFFRRK